MFVRSSLLFSVRDVKLIDNDSAAAPCLSCGVVPGFMTSLGPISVQRERTGRVAVQCTGRLFYGMTDNVTMRFWHVDGKCE